MSSHQKVYQAISQIKLKDLVTSVILAWNLTNPTKTKVRNWNLNEEHETERVVLLYNHFYM